MIRASGLSQAGVAPTQDLHLDVPFGQRAGQSVVVSGGDHEVRETGDGATLTTQKVCCVIGVSMVAGHLEAPGAVPQLGAAQLAGFGQIHEVAIQGAAIPGVPLERLGHLGVTHGPIFEVENLQHRHARRCGPQASATNLRQEAITRWMRRAG